MVCLTYKICRYCFAYIVFTRIPCTIPSLPESELITLFWASITMLTMLIFLCLYGTPIRPTIYSANSCKIRLTCSAALGSSTIIPIRAILFSSSNPSPPYTQFNARMLRSNYFPFAGVFSQSSSGTFFSDTCRAARMLRSNYFPFAGVRIKKNPAPKAREKQANVHPNNPIAALSIHFFSPPYHLGRTLVP